MVKIDSYEVLENSGEAAPPEGDAYSGGVSTVEGGSFPASRRVAPLPPLKPSVLDRAKRATAVKSNGNKNLDSTDSEGFESSSKSVFNSEVGAGKQRLSAKFVFQKVQKRKLMAREQLTIWFVSLQIVMVLLGYFAAKRLETAVLHVETSTSSALVAGVELLYKAKFIHMSNGFRAMEGESLIKDFAANPNPANAVTVQTRLVAEVNNRQIEFATLLDKDFRILVNSNRNRTGEVWNPSGVLTQLKAAYALSTSTYQIKVAATLSYAELIAEMPPLFLERADIGSPALVNKHPYLTYGESLVRYVATVVRDSSGATIGYLVSGDIVDGKIEIPGNLKLALWGSASDLVTDGVIGVYAADAHPDKTLTHPGWRDCSHAAIATIFALNSRTMSAELDPPVSHLLEQAQRDNGTSVSTFADRRSSYIYSARIAPDVYIGPAGLQPPNQSPVILVQASFSPYWLSAWFFSFRITLLIFGIDIVALSLAIYLFILPLERLGRRIRDGKPLSANATGELKSRRHWLLVVILIPLTSFALSVYNATSSMRFYLDSEVSASIKQTAMVTMTYLIKVEQMRYGFIGQSSNPLIVAYGASVTASTNPASVPSSDVKSLLQAQVALRKIELAAYVGVDGKMWVNANSDVVGIPWDTPGGAVAQALLIGVPVLSSEILTYEQYSVFNSTMWTKAYTPTTPASALHPEMRKEHVLCRFAVVPIFAEGSSVVLGALVAADIVNGMTEIPEYANTLVELGGYTAIYIKASSTSDYELVSSALMNNNATEVDIPLPADKLENILTPIYNNPITITTARIQLRGDDHVLTARCAPSNYRLLPEGRIFDEVGPDTRCSIIFVQTVDESFNKKNFQEILIVQSVLVSAQFVKLIALALLLRQAFLPFKKIVLAKGMVRIVNKR